MKHFVDIVSELEPGIMRSLLDNARGDIKPWYPINVAMSKGLSSAALFDYLHSIGTSLSPAHLGDWTR